MWSRSGESANLQARTVHHDDELGPRKMRRIDPGRKRGKRALATESEPPLPSPVRRGSSPCTNGRIDGSTVVAVFDSHERAEAAVRELQEDGFDMKRLSIVGTASHAEAHAVGYYTTGDRMLYWGKLGAFWGGFWGLLLGSAFFWVPGVGPLLVAGPLVFWIVVALEEAAFLARPAPWGLPCSASVSREIAS